MVLFSFIIVPEVGNPSTSSFNYSLGSFNDINDGDFSEGMSTHKASFAYRGT